MSRDPSLSLASAIAEASTTAADLIGTAIDGQGDRIAEVRDELRALRVSIDALAAVILVAWGTKLGGIPLADARPMGPDFVGQANFVKKVREEFE